MSQLIAAMDSCFDLTMPQYSIAMLWLEALGKETKKSKVLRVIV